MSKLSKCVYGGGSSCERQGGDGSSAHTAAYVHPFPSLAEVGEPLGDSIEPPLRKGELEVHTLLGLEEFFDEDLSKSVLDLSFYEAVDSIDLVRKSIYEFDLDTNEGITKLLEVIPILDSELMRDLAQEVWPGWGIEGDLDTAMLRAELKGYMLDQWVMDEDNSEEETAPATEPD